MVDTSRTPLLKATTSGTTASSCRTPSACVPTTPISPWSITPGSPVSNYRTVDNALKIITALSGVIVLACLASFGGYVLRSNSDAVSRTLGRVTLAWGADAQTYQACRTADPATTTLPNLVPVSSWSSLKEPVTDSISVVTHLSLESLTSLRWVCESWEASVIAVIYVPFIDGYGAFSESVPAINGSSFDSLVKLLGKFHQEMETLPDGGCALDLELVLEEFASLSSPELNQYPANALRNRAIMRADFTDLVMLLDSGFVPTAELPKYFKTHPKALHKLSRRLVVERTAMVVPAFGMGESADGTPFQGKDTRDLIDMVVQGGKTHVVAAVRRKAIEQFGVKSIPEAEYQTNITRWIDSKSLYKVDFALGYAPNLIIPRAFVPFFDERFRGNVENKDRILHMAYLTQSLKISLEVHPTAFVVHSGTPKVVPVTGTMTEPVQSLYDETLQELLTETYTPVTSFARWCAKVVERKGFFWGTKPSADAVAAAKGTRSGVNAGSTAAAANLGNRKLIKEVKV